mmetsp:Transcript_7916/g.19111  ORF Transcript_7916/g.19111 Transcript_7916/m.19111 type:complete len:138 (+) Transcript_7916:1720-2133(+)
MGTTICGLGRDMERNAHWLFGIGSGHPQRWNLETNCNRPRTVNTVYFYSLPASALFQFSCFENRLKIYPFDIKILLYNVAPLSFSMTRLFVLAHFSFVVGCEVCCRVEGGSRRASPLLFCAMHLVATMKLSYYCIFD